MMYAIKEELLNKILGVLGALPYAQVATLIGEIRAGVTSLEPKEEVRNGS